MRIQNRIMLGAVIFVLCAAAAYAQVSISSIPVTTVRSTGRAELAGAVRLSNGAVATSPDTLTVRYGVPITSPLNTAPAPVTLGNANGMFVDTTGGWTCSIATVDYVNGIVTLTCPSAAANQYFQLAGVRVSMDGFAGQTVTATIGTLVTPIVAGQDSAPVINSVATGLVSGGAGTSVTVLANTTSVVATGKLFLKEGFAASWKTQTDEGTGATQATQILLTVAGLPAGVTLTGTIVTSGALTAAWVGGTNTFTSTGTTQTIAVTAESLTAVETLEVDFTASFAGATLPLAANTYTVTASFTPNDAALTVGGQPVTTPAYHAPKFATSNISQTILTVVPNMTNLLIPYASTSAGYNTGIAIANSTMDPFTVGSATPQKGTITFYFYPQAATPSATVTPSIYTTSATTPGTGLDASGNLITGSTYTTLLSQLLPLATPALPATGFSGYIIAIVQVSDVHGISFISDFAGKFTSFSPALIVPYTGYTNALTGATGNRSSLTFESLGF